MSPQLKPPYRLASGLWVLVGGKTSLGAGRGGCALTFEEDDSYVRLFGPAVAEMMFRGDGCMALMSGCNEDPFGDHDGEHRYGALRAVWRGKSCPVINQDGITFEDGTIVRPAAGGMYVTFLWRTGAIGIERVS